MASRSRRFGLVIVRAAGRNREVIVRENVINWLLIGAALLAALGFGWSVLDMFVRS